jgi:hypothetical protein
MQARFIEIVGAKSRALQGHSQEDVGKCVRHDLNILNLKKEVTYESA